MRLWHCLLVFFLILGTGLLGIHNYKTAYETARAELLQARQEIDILKTMAISQEWYIADEKRKNAAHTEYIKIFKAVEK